MTDSRTNSHHEVGDEERVVVGSAAEKQTTHARQHTRQRSSETDKHTCGQTHRASHTSAAKVKVETLEKAAVSKQLSHSVLATVAAGPFEHVYKSQYKWEIPTQIRMPEAF